MARPITARRREHAHVAFLTPTAPSETAARDVAAALQANVDPYAAGIGPVVLRHTRYGGTSEVVSAVMSVRMAEKRHPHVRLVSVDPDVSAKDLIRVLNARNPGLQLDPQTTGSGILNVTRGYEVTRGPVIGSYFECGA